MNSIIYSKHPQDNRNFKNWSVTRSAALVLNISRLSMKTIRSCLLTRFTQFQKITKSPHILLSRLAEFKKKKKKKKKIHCGLVFELQIWSVGDNSIFQIIVLHKYQNLDMQSPTSSSNQHRNIRRVQHSKQLKIKHPNNIEKKYPNEELIQKINDCFSK